MRALVVLALAGSLTGCATIAEKTTGIPLTKDVVTKEQVQTACEVGMIAYGVWEAAGTPGVAPGSARLKRIRAAYNGVQTACLALPTTPMEGLSAVMAAINTAKAELAAARAP